MKISKNNAGHNWSRWTRSIIIRHHQEQPNDYWLRKTQLKVSTDLVNLRKDVMPLEAIMKGHANDQSKELHVLVFKDDDLWIAQCLEYDIAVQARTIEELEENFVCSIIAHVMSSIEDKEAPFSTLPETPKEFWDMFQRAKQFRDPLQIETSSSNFESDILDLIPREAVMALSEPPYGAIRH